MMNMPNETREYVRHLSERQRAMELLQEVLDRIEGDGTRLVLKRNSNGRLVVRGSNHPESGIRTKHEDHYSLEEDKSPNGQFGPQRTTH